MKENHQNPRINDPEQYDRFIDAVRLSLIVWRRSGNGDFSEVSRKLGISERTVRRRFNDPGTLTLQEFFAWCELYGKEPTGLLLNALTKKEVSGE